MERWYGLVLPERSYREELLLELRVWCVVGPNPRLQPLRNLERWYDPRPPDIA